MDRKFVAVPAASALAAAQAPPSADRAFAAGMIPRNSGAMDMARIVRDDGRDSEVRALAESIIRAQRRGDCADRAIIERIPAQWRARRNDTASFAFRRTAGRGGAGMGAFGTPPLGSGRLRRVGPGAG